MSILQENLAFLQGVVRIKALLLVYPEKGGYHHEVAHSWEVTF